MTGFGIAILGDKVFQLMRFERYSKEDAVRKVAKDAELRSEAVMALREFVGLPDRDSSTP